MKEMDKRINKAFENITPNVLGSVLRDIDTEKGSVIQMTEIRKKKSFIPKMVAVAAALVVLVVGAFTANMLVSQNRVVSTVAIEVNPSLQLHLNNNERVVRVDALNRDGKVVLGDMDLKGSDVETAVNAIIGSMLKNGYLNDVANSVLVSVDNSDAEKSAKLQKELSARITAVLNTDAYSGSVICQTAEHDTELSALAKEYGISEGKAQLIREIVAKDATYKMEDLAKLSINELNLIANSGQKHLTSAESTGNASQKAYIGAEQAESIARQDAEAKGKEVLGVYDVEMDYEHGRMIYELEVKIAGGEYEYDIDAKTGEILYCELDREDDRYEDKDDDNDDYVPENDSYIGRDAALSKAYAHAGVEASDVREVECELDRENGAVSYEISFECGGYEYEYDIDAVSGKIIKSEKDRED